MTKFTDPAGISTCFQEDNYTSRTERKVNSASEKSWQKSTDSPLAIEKANFLSDLE